MEKQTPSQIFNKTIKYVILRMLIPIVSAIVSIVALKITTKIAAPEPDQKLGIISTIIWLLISVLIYVGLEFFFGYKLHAGHMAILTDATSMKMVPDDMDNLAKECTAERFPSGNEYFQYRRAVKSSIQQLQMQLNTFAENRLRVPVLGQLIRFCQFVIGHVLSFTYDLVLCYTFWRDGKTLYTSAADGIAVYWDAWKRMMENILIFAVIVIAGMATGFAFVGVLVAVACSTASGPLAGGIAGVYVGYLACQAAKVYLDTNLAVKTLGAYFDEGRYADYSEEEYGIMCQNSKAYDKLYRKAVNEAFAPPPMPVGGYEVY